MKTLLTVLTLASAVVATTSAWATDFSNDFVVEKISQHWELDTLEITQRIDVKKRREMKNKSVEVAEGDLQSFESALKTLMQQNDGKAVDKADIAEIMSGFAQPGTDMQMLSIEGSDNDDFPSPDALMLTDISDYDATLMIEESLIVKSDGSVFYADSAKDSNTEQSTDETEVDEVAAAKWTFDEARQQLIVTEQQDNLSISANYKLLELSDKHMVLEEQQRDSSVKMIFSSK